MSNTMTSQMSLLDFQHLSKDDVMIFLEKIKNDERFANLFTAERLTLKPAEAAELLNISMPTMYELCRRKDFPKIRIGRAIIIPKSSLETWLEKQAEENEE